MPRKHSFLYRHTAQWEFGELWTRSAKPWDYRKPFHRINSPAHDDKVDESRERSEWKPLLDGLGCKCGCHAPSEYEPGLLDKFFKTIAGSLGIPDSLDDLLAQVDRAMPGDDPATKAAREALKKSIKDAVESVSKEVASFSLSKWLAGFLEGAVLDHLMRRLPAWVPVERGGDEIKEIEGVAFNSFLDHRSFPYSQWHSWYDWNFHIIPYRGYQYLQSKGNRLFDAAGSDWEVDYPFDMPSYAPWIMECKWDSGALGGKANDAGTYVPPMLDRPSGLLGADRDWCWPQPGQYVWLSGRWVYNCQAATNRDTKGLMRSELHPCRAIATARWEAVSFPENQRPVQAIQFMFFQNLTGSYVDTPAGPETYEFIVDLPPIDLDTIVYPVGSTHPVGASDDKAAGETFPLNSLVVRPRLLQRFDTAPFASVANTASLAHPPKIELLRPTQDERGLYQAKITITVGKSNIYGIVISLGWHDPGNVHAAKVKRVRIKFDHLHKHGIDHDWFAEQWRLNVGVNGRWFQLHHQTIHNDTRYPLGAELVLHLHEDDYLTLSAHGTEGDDEDTYIRKRAHGSFFEDRALRALRIEFVDLPGADRLPAPWNQIKIPKRIGFDPAEWKDIDIRPAGQTESTLDERKQVSGLARDFVYQGILVADGHNDMLGRIAPDRDPRRLGSGGDMTNQIQLKQLVGQIGLGKPTQMTLTAYEWKDLRDSAEATFRNPQLRDEQRDYTLEYTVTVEEPT